MNDLYYPNEHALLCSWFRLPVPKACKDIDLFDPPEDAEGIWPDQIAHSDEARALDNAVARLALGSIQHRLPQVGFVNREGGVVLGRSYYPKPNRPVELLPQFLFMINWADTAPGLSWPESYHVAYLPGYDRYVVTASWDSTDMYGCTELAIGTFGGDGDVLNDSKEAITGWWQEAANDYDQHRWAYVWQEGLVSGEVAEAWADEVWNDGTDMESAVATLQSEGVGEDEISEALHNLVVAVIDGSPFTFARERAEDAFWECLDPGKTPVANLLEVVQAVGQLGRDGRCLAHGLMTLLDDPRLADDNAIRTAIVHALDDNKPDDVAVHNRLVAILTDASEPGELRRACAQTLHTITGLDEYATIRAMFPGKSIFKAAPHDSSIFRGGREWYEPKPSKAMRKAAQRVLSKLTRSQQAGR